MGIFKNVWAVVTGAVSSILTIFAGEYGMSVFYPLPAGIDINNRYVLGKAIAAMPLSAFIFLLAAHALSAVVGGVVATLLSRRVNGRPAIVVGLILVISAVYNLYLIPHPIWFALINACEYLPLVYLGYLLSSKNWGAKAN
ncbi:MAG: hypothetical protein H7257_08405 [Taibaiella sp.]|nr:hypothetical protein [Taibaiella sp.]